MPAKIVKYNCAGLMSKQPLLDFLNTLPVFITNAPPVIGVSEQAQVKVLLQLDRSLTSIFIDPGLLESPLDLRARILEAIFDAQQFRERQVQLIISRHTCIANLSLWDVEGTLLAVKGQQAAAFSDTYCCARNHLVSVGREQRGDIDRLVLNSMRLNDAKTLESAIVDAARQGHEKIRNLQKAWPFAELGWL
jgi:DNA-binding protein YbaB